MHYTVRGLKFNFNAVRSGHVKEDESKQTVRNHSFRT